MKPKPLPPLDMLLTLVLLHLAEAIAWYDDDVVEVEIRTVKGEVKKMPINLDHLSALEAAGLVKLSDRDGDTGSVALTGRGRKVAASTRMFNQVNIN